MQRVSPSKVIAGDGWGELAVPVILAAPETSVVFIGRAGTQGVGNSPGLPYEL